MRLTWRLALNMFTVLLLGIGMVAWLVTQLIGNSNLVQTPFTVTADFAASGGVFSNQEVTYRGVLIGKVGEMSLGEDNDGVTIELLIDPEWEDRIPADVGAEVQSKSAVGEQFVNLTPAGTGTDAMLQEGDEIPRSRTKLPVDFQALLRSLDKVLDDIAPGQTNRLVRNLSSGLQGREEDLKAILASLSTLSDTFADTASEQTRLLQNSTAAGEAFLASKDEFSAAIRSADKVFEGLGDEPGELKRFFAANDRVAREGIGLLRRQSKNYLAGIRGLADLTEFQLRERDVIAGSFDHVPGFLHAIEDASVPWKSPDGRKFYRIRGGLILDNVPTSWPCPYRNAFEYERLPHERNPRSPDTRAECQSRPSANAARQLAAALEAWASDDPKLAELRSLWEDGELPVVSTTGFRWPINGAVTSRFGPRWGRMHEGIDIDGDHGDPIGASATGRVVRAGEYSGYGNAVVIDHGDGVATLYGHLSSIGVDIGDPVIQGQFIGRVGCTGHCFGDHLHFEIIVNGIPVDPLPYLDGTASIFGDAFDNVLQPIGDDPTDDEQGKGKPRKNKKPPRKDGGSDREIPRDGGGKPPKPKPTPKPTSSPTPTPTPTPDQTATPTPAPTEEASPAP
jgi:virulence factor Mce-like protein